MVTQKMLETLALIARMPKGYRRIRADRIKQRYGAHLAECSHAHEALMLLLEEATEAEVSEGGKACYEAVTGSAEQSVRSLAAR